MTHKPSILNIKLFRPLSRDGERHTSSLYIRGREETTNEKSKKVWYEDENLIII